MSRMDTVEPLENRIADSQVLPRAIHLDPRGLLVETLRSDDGAVDGSTFAMSYTSVTVPGQKRDVDRWHVHGRQVDRFVVPLGEMILALYDARSGSRSEGRLELIRMVGAPLAAPRASAGPSNATTYLVTIPIGVYHSIGNLHPTEPFVLQNYPTRLYDPSDEGRVPFVDVPIRSRGGATFDWDRVDVRRPPPPV